MKALNTDLDKITMQHLGRCQVSGKCFCAGKVKGKSTPIFKMGSPRNTA